MGKFTDWMMKGMDDNEDDGSYKRNRRESTDNNFDRFVSNCDGRRSEPVRQTFSREERAMPRHEEQRATLPLMTSEGSSSVKNVVLFSPKSFEDVQTLIDFLKRREPSVVDLVGVSDSSAQRILDFLSGAIYALSGSIHRISGSIFLLTPSGVSITVPTDLKNKLEGR